MYADHRLRLGFAQLILWLEDVDDTTHIFSISPEAAGAELLDPEGQLARDGSLELHGKAGAAALINVSRLHTVIIRPTMATRKSIQIYYGHRHRPDWQQVTFDCRF